MKKMILAMMPAYRMLTVLCITCIIVACDKESQPTNETVKKLEANAEIIAFNPDKCSCCWGWIIRMSGDTIKADSLPNADKIGMNISTPVPVYLELGGKKEDCSSFPPLNPFVNKDYYVIKRLELIEK